MKICPFISHMLGDDNSKTLTIDDDTRSTDESPTGDSKVPGNVVILGYEGGPSGAQTDTMTKPKQKTVVPTHLYCLKEPCRFYEKQHGDCRFDLMFDMLKGHKPKEPDAKTPDLTKGIDKIWKFQTQSVEEMIKTIGGIEKNQTKAFTKLKKDFDKVATATKTPKRIPDAEVNKKLDALGKKLDDREEAFENLTATFSDLVVNVTDGISQLQKRSDSMDKQMGKIQTALSSDSDSIDGATIKKIVEETVSKNLAAIEIPDIKAPIRDLEKKLVETLDKQTDSKPDLEAKLDDALKSHSAIKQKIETGYDKIAEKIQALESHQTKWEDEIGKLVEQHSELTGYLEDNKKHRQDDDVRKGRKAAKKMNNLGVTSFHNGAYDMAKDQFLQALKTDPEFAEAHNNLGLAYTELSDDDKATEAFSKAVKLNPSLHAAYNNLGYIYFKQGNYDQAIEMYNEALGRSTNNSSAYTNLGNAYYKLGKMADARSSWTKALEIDPGNEKARRNLQRMSDEDTE